MSDIAIIGGGAAGAAVFGSLLRRGAAGTVHWVTGETPVPGRGVAYGTRDERHLLNVRASHMGLYVDEDEGFAHFCARQRPGFPETDFASRWLFGDFIESQLTSRMAEAAAKGQPYVLHGLEAVSVAPHGGGYEVKLANGDALRVGAVVLALGILPPLPFSGTTARALASGAYVVDPWNLPQYPSRPPHRVIVIGTGLTAVDTLLSASAWWPDAEFIAVSRHGLWSSVHAQAPTTVFASQAEVNAALLSCRSPLAMLRVIRRTLRDHPGLDWRSLIDGMRPHNPTLWQGMSEAGRRRFLRHLRWLWDVSRHRAPPRSAAAIQRLLDSGRLTLRAARVVGIDGDGPLDVMMRTRASGEPTVLQADMVVQATGLNLSVALSDRPLIMQLLRDGLVKADPLQLGLSAEPDGRLIDAQGHARPGLYAIGPMLCGNLWECIAMPEIRSMANELAYALKKAASLVVA